MAHPPVAARLQALREQMQFQSVQASIWPTSDPHLSEYLPDRWKSRQWLSGFVGSAGLLVVTADWAGLWTDSRYWEQAAKELEGSGIQLQRAGEAGVPEPANWLAEHLPARSRVALDSQSVSAQSLLAWQKATPELEWVLETDLLSPIWTDRPAAPVGQVVEHRSPFACRTRQENLSSTRAAMQEQGAHWHLLSALDDIAWTLNLRGSDVSYNPVFLSYLLIGPDQAFLFVDGNKLSAGIQEAMAADGVQVQGYTELSSFMRALPASMPILLDMARTTAWAAQLAAHLNVVEYINPAQLLKSCKTDAELDHVRETMEKDGAALCEFFAWFEQQSDVNELDVDEHICAARARQEGFVSPSFGTIAAYNANGAMPHYQATQQSHARIDGNGLLLIDSGGQYQGGTTDITRVVPVGQVSAEQIRDFTLVLKGMVSLSMLVFPEGIAGQQIDVLARQPLWEQGLDFGHGTGHGVGYFMNVHEGPQSISWRGRIGPHSAMRAGMITSNEPGLYRPGQWGIRIENLVAAVPAMRSEYGQFLRFETLTLCPIDTRCIDAALLTAAERNWLNEYHQQVRERLMPRVQGDARKWLEQRTQAI
ncbi:aminopeptidase P family protein [Alcaligenes faecalis]|uniref:aminopeptidase P family protein n=1 Tax=Alcaligenes faecalis TaxID=511 RepID=UPI000F6605FF|nr:aminopeptidase P family protein [Alcaligenes faecalis]MBQ0218412.1 aminopeptidase P family protein [Alcaligenes faecalis]RSE63777.1 aminopeptidase P family protein [Alcaligenes faecalis]